MGDRITDPTRLLTRRSHTTCIGYDYGISAHALLAIDHAFVDLLYEAKIVGCAYGFEPSANAENPLRIFSLVAHNADPARRAFEVFKQWADAVDADCVHLEIVVLESGGYVLTIGPEPERSSIRLAGYGSLFQPMTVGYTYVKKLDTVSRGLLDLRNYKQSPISPVLFTAAVTSAREPTAKMSLERIAGCPELIKFEFKLTDESEARRNPFTNALLDDIDKSATKRRGSPRPREDLTPKQIGKQRISTLKQCFPVTLHRIRVTSALQTLKTSLTALGIRDWQFDQAICNLQISELCHKYLLAHPDREDEDAPLAVLSSRFEDVLGSFRSVNLFQIKQQLLADAQYLIKSIDSHLEPATTLYECAAQLAHLDVLNG